MAKKLTGIVPPLVTPLLDDNTLDVKGLERLVERVIAGGVHGIFILGTTGEAQSLGFDLRVKMIEQSSRIIKGRLPLLVGISDTSIADSVKLAKVAKDCGADAVVSAPPYYYATGQPELIDFYRTLIEQLPLPLYLYNMPSHTKVAFTPATIKAIAEDKRVIGFKDSSANGGFLQAVIHEMRHREDFAIFVGPEEMTAEVVLMGGAGGVNGGANMFPELYVALYNAAKEQNIERVRELQAKVMEISALIYSVGRHGSSYLKGVKCALNVLGVCSPVLATPFRSFHEPESGKIKRAVESIEKIL